MDPGPITLTQWPSDEHPDRVRVDGRYTTAIWVDRAEAAGMVNNPIWGAHAMVALDHYDS